MIVTCCLLSVVISGMGPQSNSLPKSTFSNIQLRVQEIRDQLEVLKQSGGSGGSKALQQVFPRIRPPSLTQEMLDEGFEDTKGSDLPTKLVLVADGVLWLYCQIWWCWCVSGSTGGAEVCCSSLWVPGPPRLPAQPAPVHAVPAPGPQQGPLPGLPLPPLPLPPPEQSQTQRPPLHLLQHAHPGCEGWQGRVRLPRLPRQPGQQPQHFVPLLLQQPALLPGTVLQH